MYRDDVDIIRCAECSELFDLAKQDYYGPRCPSCRAAIE